MRKRSTIGRALALSAAVAAALSGVQGPRPAAAATDNWQGGSATAPTWDQAANWDLGAKPGTGDDAVFPSTIPATPGATISLGAGETANSLTLNAAYTLGSAAGSGDLTLTTGSVTVASSVTATIASQLKGTAGLTLNGPGTLALTNTTTATTNNNFTGGINVNAGTLAFNADAELGTAGAANTITLNGGTLNDTAGAQVTFATGRVISLGASGGTLNLTNNVKLQLGTGAITGSGTLTRTGTANNTGNNLSLVGANANFSGAWVLNGGVVEANAGTLGNASATNTVTINTGAELANSNTTLGQNITINGGVLGGDNAAANIAGSTYSGSVTVNAAFKVRLGYFYNNTNNQNLTISGPVSGTGAFTFLNAGTSSTISGQTLFLAGNNSAYNSDVNIPAGYNVSFGSTASGSAGLNNGARTVNTTATQMGGIGFGYDFGSSVPAFTNSRASGVTTGGVFGVNAALASTTTLDLSTLGGGGMLLGSQGAGTYAAPTLTIAGTNYPLGGGGGTLTFSAANVITGAGNSVTVGDTRTNGGGIIAFGAAQNYGGSTTVTNGTLRLAVNNAIPSSTPVTLGATGTVGILDLAGVSQQLFSLATGSGATAASQLVGNSSTTANSTLTLDTTGAPISFGGTLQNVLGSGNKTLALVKQGANPLTLGSGNSSYSGGTTILNGTVTAGSLGIGPVNLGDVSGSNPVTLLTDSTANRLIPGNVVARDTTTGPLTLGGTNTTGVSYYTGSVTLGSTPGVGKSLTLSAAAGGEVDFSGPVLSNGGDPTAGLNVVNSTGSGTATVRLNAAASTYAGGTTVNGGAKLVATAVTGPSGAGPLGTGPVNLNGGTLSLNFPTGLSGFGTNGVGYRLNAVNVTPTIASNVLTLTTNVTNQGASAWADAAQPVAAGFTAKFTYTPSGNKAADGVTFALQNDARNVTTLGGIGGSFGYGGVTPSAAVELNIYTGAAGGIGTAFATNGAVNTNQSVSPVSLGGGNPINVTVTYDGNTTLTETLNDATANTTKTVTYTLSQPLATTLGSPTAFVGFTGATGGLAATQAISNFTYTPVSAPAALPNDVAVAAGTSSGLDLTNVPSATMGALSLGSGSTLNVTGSAAAANAPFALTLSTATLAGPAALNVANNGTGTGTLALGAAFESAPSTLTKQGPGLLSINGPVNLTGGVVVSAGTLGGNASLSGPLSVSAGGTVAPGNSVGTISSANLSLAPGASYAVELDPTNSQGNGTADQLNVTGTVTLGGSNLAVALLSAPTLGQTFTVVLNDDIDPVSGTFAQGSIVTANFGGTPYAFSISYNANGGDGSANDVVLTSVPVPTPEPAGAALLGLAAAGLLARRRR